MIIKNIFKIHPLYYIVAFICFLTGHFKQFIIFSSIIIIHELGHFTAALIFKWKIESLILLPFGGVTIFKEYIDKPLKEELLIALAGPLFQIIFFLIFKENQLFTNYNKFIIMFNLLPIFPLDGAKITNVFLNHFFSFKLSHKLTIIISIFTLLAYHTFKHNLIFILVIIFLIIEIIKEIYKHKYYFNKFLLERYIYKFKFKKVKIIKKITDMRKQTTHLFNSNNIFYKEEDIIRKMFDN